MVINNVGSNVRNIVDSFFVRRFSVESRERRRCCLFYGPDVLKNDANVLIYSFAATRIRHGERLFVHRPKGTVVLARQSFRGDFIKNSTRYRTSSVTYV